MIAKQSIKFVCILTSGLLIFCSLTGTTQVKAAESIPKALVVLLPGLGNATFDTVFYRQKFGNKSSGYFSKYISQSILDLGYDCLAIRGLGHTEIHQNGVKALASIRAYYLSHYEGQNVPIYLLGHSLGGLFAASIAHLNKDQLPIKKLITMGTPWLGSELIELFTHNKLSEQLLRGLAGTLAPIFDFRAAFGLTPHRVEQFLAGLKIPSHIKIYAFTGWQKPNRILFPSLSPNLQPPAYLPLAKLLGAESDGAVRLSSSLPENLTLASTNKAVRLKVQSVTAEMAFLDHGEQHLAPKAVQKVFLTRKIHLIAKRQYEFYQFLLNYVETVGAK